MFALAALICFVLVVFGVSAAFSLVALGLAFVALHLLVGVWPFAGGYPWSRRQ
jgi:hypothetical protein